MTEMALLKKRQFDLASLYATKLESEDVIDSKSPTHKNNPIGRGGLQESMVTSNMVYSETNCEQSTAKPLKLSQINVISTRYDSDTTSRNRNTSFSTGNNMHAKIPSVISGLKDNASEISCP
jgi:hypothetical protein